MRRTLLFLAALALGAHTTFSQTTTVDYTTWNTLTPNCNAFGAGNTVVGFTHVSILGQPKFDINEEAVTLDCSRQGTNGEIAKSTAYAIHYNFQEGHTYKFTFKTKQENALGTLSGVHIAFHGIIITPSTLCNGPQPDATEQYPGGTGFIAATNGYELHDVYLSAPADPYFIKVKAEAAPTSQATKVFIQKISWVDVTPPFTLTASSTSRLCGTQNPVTFTIENPTGASVDGYKFYPQAGKWLYQGNPAPAEIVLNSSSANAITLVPVECAGPATVYGRVLRLGNVSTPTNGVTTGVTLPPYGISGPSTLPYAGALYTLTGDPLIFPKPPASFPCGATVSWGFSSNPVGAELSVNSPTNVGVTPSTLFPQSGLVTLTATVNGCGVSKNVNKNINVQAPLLMSGGTISTIKENGGLSVKAIHPNPTNGKFTVELSHQWNNRNITIRSIDGRVIAEQKVAGQSTDFDISEVPAGLYFLTVSDGRQTIVEKIVKR